MLCPESRGSLATMTPDEKIQIVRTCSTGRPGRPDLQSHERDVGNIYYRQAPSIKP